MPPEQSTDKPRKTRIVIVGAGIVGVCCAYYLTEHPQFDDEKYEIEIVEAVRPACAASGKAGGLLSRAAFPQQIAPLSFQLHEDLAKQYKGETAWGYRRVKTVSIGGNKFKSNQEPTATLPAELDWIKPDLITEFEALGEEETYAQVHPYLFTTFILRRVTERGVRLVTGKVESISGENGVATGVNYIPAPNNNDGNSESYLKNGSNVAHLQADHIIIASGPWTSKLLPACPLVGIKAHSITLQPTRPVSAYALFTDLRVSKYQYVSPEVYARKDEIFISGEGSQDPLPETADLVKPNIANCDQLFSEASIISDEIKGGHVLRKQACYLPVIDSPSCSGPLVGKTDVTNLLVATGHSCWGINNAPATGLLISELIMTGETTSASLKGLEPFSHFEARDALANS